MRAAIYELVQAITPHDELERHHQLQTAAWIASGAPLFRVRKPADPPQHLVAYFALVDPAARKLLLVDHRLAGLWLPSGGHVEPDEHPAATVRREAAEELGIAATLLRPEPLFLTVSQTVGSTAQHTDVSLWYVVAADSATSLEFDAGEFRAIRWFAFDELPYERADPYLRRFVAKLKAALPEL